MKEIKGENNYNSFILGKTKIIYDIINYQEFFILKDNKINKIIIDKKKMKYLLK